MCFILVSTLKRTLIKRFLNIIKNHTRHTCLKVAPLSAFFLVDAVTMMAKFIGLPVILTYPQRSIISGEGSQTYPRGNRLSCLN